MLLTITVARSDSGIAYTWQDDHFDTMELTLVAPGTYYGNDCTFVVNPNPTQEVKAMTVYAPELNALTERQLIDALEQFHGCKLDLSDPEWKATVLKYARENWFLEVDEDTGNVKIMGEEWQSGFGEFVKFHFVVITVESRYADMGLLKKALEYVRSATTVIHNMNEQPIEDIPAGLKTLDDELCESIMYMEEAIDEMITAPSIKDMLTLFRKVNDDCMRHGNDSVPFSDTEFYAEQIETIYEVPYTQAEELARRLSLFEYFQKDAEDVDDISKYNDTYESHTPGRIYLSDGISCALAIESTKNWEPQYKEEGAWYLVVGNQQWQSDNLEELELELFDFALSAGWLDKPEVEVPDCSPAGEPC